MARWVLPILLMDSHILRLSASGLMPLDFPSLPWQWDEGSNGRTKISCSHSRSQSLSFYCIPCARISGKYKFRRSWMAWGKWKKKWLTEEGQSLVQGKSSLHPNLEWVQTGMKAFSQFQIQSHSKLNPKSHSQFQIQSQFNASREIAFLYISSPSILMLTFITGKCRAALYKHIYYLMICYVGYNPI